jgi:hypothetical protein
MQPGRIGGTLLLLACGIAMGQAATGQTVMGQPRDPRVDDLAKETAQLKRIIADQDRRIAELEKTVKALQGAAAPAPARIPADTPPWQLTSNWNLLKKGMSEAQVVEILGPAVRVESAVDKRTLYYAPDARSAATPNGSVTLVDDRLTASVPPIAKDSRIPSETPP